MSDLGPCRSCHAAMRWARTTKGKNIPLDREPNVQRGNVLLVGEGHEERAHVFGDPEKAVAAALELGTDPNARYLSHFATCPNRTKHRRRRS